MSDFKVTFGSAAAWIDAKVAHAAKTGRPYAEIVMLTPPLAQELLGRNPNNRKLVQSSIRRIVDAIESGNWDLNGESIVISDNGQLNDGQHRLTAIVQADAAVESFVVFGVSRVSRETLDQGQKRNCGHVLGMYGVENSTAVAAAARLILSYRHNVSLSTYWQPTSILSFCADAEGLDEAVRMGRLIGRRLTGGSAIWSAAIWLAQQGRYAQQAKAFFAGVESGLGLTSTSPIYQLRTRVERIAASRSRLSHAEILAWIIKAFNAYVVGKPMGVLRWNEGSGEAFPRFLT